MTTERPIPEFFDEIPSLAQRRTTTYAQTIKFKIIKDKLSNKAMHRKLFGKRKLPRKKKKEFLKLFSRNEYKKLIWQYNPLKNRITFILPNSPQKYRFKIG